MEEGGLVGLFDCAQDPTGLAIGGRLRNFHEVWKKLPGHGPLMARIFLNGYQLNFRSIPRPAVARTQRECASVHDEILKLVLKKAIERWTIPRFTPARFLP